MTAKFAIEIPNDIVNKVGIESQMFAEKFRLAAAAKLYELNDIDIALATALADLDAATFTNEIDSMVASPILDTIELSSDTTVQFDISENILSALNMDLSTFTAELRLAAAVKWYESHRVDHDLAAEISGVCRARFINTMERYSASRSLDTIDYVVMTTVHVDIDAQTLTALRGKLSDVEHELRLAAAMKWYETGLLNQDEASQVADMSRSQFSNAFDHVSEGD